MALPIAWYWFHVRRWMKAGADWSFLTSVVISGVVILLFITFVGILAFSGIFRTNLWAR
jgi:hypothetical protein